MNKLYKSLLAQIMSEGKIVKGRNGTTISHIGLPQLCFTGPPLITSIRPAYKLAAVELGWMLSPVQSAVPPQILHWWHNQLNPDNMYVNGYNYQFRFSSYKKPDNTFGNFDQISYVINILKKSEGSRQALISAWNTGEMATITEANNCLSSPACCHDTATQFFVRENKLWLKTYQRSCDMRLGFIHNIYQSWMLLHWVAHNTGYEIGGVYYILGDAHIYHEATHLEAVNKLLSYSDETLDAMPVPQFSYLPTSLDFIPTDFSVTGIPEPLVKVKSNLL